MNNVFFLEAAMHGKYPKAFVGEPPFDVMGFKAGDEKLLYAPLDWIGFHYYTRRVVADASKEKFQQGGNFSGTEIEGIRQAAAILIRDSVRRCLQKGR